MDLTLSNQLCVLCPFIELLYMILYIVDDNFPPVCIIPKTPNSLYYEN